MSSSSTRSIAAIGDVSSPAAWSGIPYFFWRAAAAADFATEPVRLNLDWISQPRRRWAVGRILRGRRPAGFQYSAKFLDAAEALIPRHQLAGEIISFSQHFPRAETVRAAGGRISYYIDATFAALSSGRGLDLRLPSDVVASARQLERQNYELADRVIAMASWTAHSVIDDCGIAAGKVYSVLPGANLDLPQGYSPPDKLTQRAGIDRPFVLGFVGVDWERKGLSLVCGLRDKLVERGWRVVVRAAGNAPRPLAAREGVEFAGFLDKSAGSAKYVELLASCDIGCLFSKHEALGISTLEFLRAGIPVAGYATEGLMDTLATDAALSFAPGVSADCIVARFDEYLRRPEEQQAAMIAAWTHSPFLDWNRCVSEMERIWSGERFAPYCLVKDREHQPASPLLLHPAIGPH
jgi:glycosyltransferase involved in cell wall biosynthesis